MPVSMAYGGLSGRVWGNPPGRPTAPRSLRLAAAVSVGGNGLELVDGLTVHVGYELVDARRQLLERCRQAGEVLPDDRR